MGNLSLDFISRVQDTSRAREISRSEVKRVCPELAQCLDQMDSRLKNNSPDCIMNTFRIFAHNDARVIVVNSNREFKNSSITVKGEEVYALAGSTFSDFHLNEFLNNKSLMPNKTYHIDNNKEYYTDSLGRVAEVHDNFFDVGDQRSDKRPNLDKVAKQKDGLQDDIGGHIVANNVDGPTESINIFPQNKDLNISKDWKAMESKVQELVSKGDGGRVTRFEYSGNSFRPQKINVEINSSEGKLNFEFLNKKP